jgi:hypothetical protein
VIRAVATLAIAVVLTGCSPSVDWFSIRRFSASTKRGFAPLDRTVSDAALASRMHAFDDRFEADLLGALGFYTRGNDLWPTRMPRP